MQNICALVMSVTLCLTAFPLLAGLGDCGKRDDRDQMKRSKFINATWTYVIEMFIYN